MIRLKSLVIAAVIAGGFCVAAPDATALAQTTISRQSRQAITRRVMKQIVGQEIVSADGKDAGVIYDLAIDSNDGRVAFAVIDHRRNGRLHAVPFELIRETDGKLSLGIEHRKLEPSNGFTKDSWPDMSDLEWARKVHANYGLTPYWELSTRRAGADDRKDAGEKAGPNYNRKYNWINRASQMVGIPLKSDTGDDLGKVSDLVLNMRSGRGHLVYLVVADAPGLRDRLTVVPFHAAQAKPSEKEFVVAAGRDALRAGSLKESEWQTTTDASWNRRVHQAFKEEPYWNVFGASDDDDAEDDSDRPFQPGAAYMQNFDTRHTRSFNGKVISVGEFDLTPNVKGKQLVILAEDEKRWTIHLGPASYFDKPKSKLNIQPGDQISVRTIRGIFEGKEVFLANQLAKVYDLRDSNGRGVWRSFDDDK